MSYSNIRTWIVRNPISTVLIAMVTGLIIGIVFL